MDANELCVCKDTAILLRDNGFPQDTYFVWCYWKEKDRWILHATNEILSTFKGEVIAAPTTDEIWELMPAYTKIMKRHEFEGLKRLPEALAQLWLKLPKEKV